MQVTTTNATDKPYGDALGLLAGSGIVLMQAAAVIPGLLPVLFLTLPLVIPLVALGLVAGVLVAVPVALWRLAALVTRPLRRRGFSVGAGRTSSADVLTETARP